MTDLHESCDLLQQFIEHDRRVTEERKRNITREQAEAAFQKLEGQLHEAFVTYGELFGGPGPRSCSATNRFVDYLKDAATQTRQDIEATDGTFLNAIPVLTMYLLGFEAGFVEHPRGWERTARAKSIIYAPDLTPADGTSRAAAEEPATSIVDGSRDATSMF